MNALKDMYCHTQQMEAHPLAKELLGLICAAYRGISVLSRYVRATNRFLSEQD